MTSPVSDNKRLFRIVTAHMAKTGETAKDLAKKSGVPYLPIVGLLSLGTLDFTLSEFVLLSASVGAEASFTFEKSEEE